MSSIICCDGGVFRFYPPTSANPEWTIETLLETPASDATLIDFDGDGKDELLVLSPFHGDTVLIYREKDGEVSLTMNIRRKSNSPCNLEREIQGKTGSHDRSQKRKQRSPEILLGKRTVSRRTDRPRLRSGQCLWIP